MHNPLEQFDIVKIVPIELFGLDFSLTNSGLMMAAVLVILLLFWLILRVRIGGEKNSEIGLDKKENNQAEGDLAEEGQFSNFNSASNLGMDHDSLDDITDYSTEDCGGLEISARQNSVHSPENPFPEYKIGRLQAAAEMIYETVEEMVGGTVGETGRRFVPFIFTLFIFILLCNLLGMVPGSFTATSHIAVTFAMAATIFVAITIIGICKHGSHFMSLFMPAGTPAFLMPLIFVVELFAYLARPISLSLRLAANMTAGHIVLKVIASFVIMSGAFLGFMPFGLLIVLTGFEFFIAILQAYIFTILTCVYLNDALNLH